MFSDYLKDIKSALAQAHAQLDPLHVAHLARMVGEDVYARFVRDVLMSHEERDSKVDESTAPSLSSLDRFFSGAHRRALGMFYTPPRWADFLAGALGFLEEEGTEAVKDDGVSGVHHVLDLSCGDGALLLATVARRGHRVCVYGVEREPACGMLAAIRIAHARQTMAAGKLPDDRILVGDDGLREDVLEQLRPGLASVDFVIGNPPYLGEKGQRAFFDALFEAHPHLVRWRGKRIDLLYLFMLQGLELLRPGGIMVHLTSAYWLQAQGASTLREQLHSRGRPILFWQRAGARLFKDAPGHHSLVTVYQKRGAEKWQGVARACLETESSLATSRDIVCIYGKVARPVAEIDVRGAGLRPFIERDVYALAAAFRERCKMKLGERFKLCQGFVSGADSVTGRHLELIGEASGLEKGDPIYLFDTFDEVPKLLQALLGQWLFPVLRGSSFAMGEVYDEPQPLASHALYVDRVLVPGEDGAYQAIVDHLEPVREVLSRRREVQSERIPWYRMHWPRERAEQLGDKLVMARRGPAWSVALDLGAHLVSSDCTYLTWRADAAASAVMSEEALRRTLRRVMTVLGLEELRRDLEVFGKQKGALYEFYSEPLEEVPLPLCEGAHGELFFDAEVLGEEQARALEEALG